MKVGTDPDVIFLSEIYQLCDELCDFDEVVSTEFLTIIILVVLPVEKKLTIKIRQVEITFNVWKIIKV